MPAFLRRFQKLSISEWILVQQVKRGDKEAFGALYELYIEKIYRYIFFRVHQHVAVAEDLTEVVFVKAWQKIDMYNKTGGSFSSWLYSIARNTVIDHFRSSARQNVVLTDDHIDEQKNVEHEVYVKFELERIQEALRFLTDEQQEIITFKFVNELSNKEIAKLLNKKEDAIRAMQYRALQELRKRLKE